MIIQRILDHVRANRTEPLSVPWSTNTEALRRTLAEHGITMTAARGDAFGVDFYSFIRTSG